MYIFMYACFNVHICACMCMCICIYLCLCICACVFDRWLEELPPGAALNWILSLLFLGPFRLHELQVNLHGLRSLFHTLLGNSLLCPVLYIFRIPQSFWSVNTSSSIFSSWYTSPLPPPSLPFIEGWLFKFPGFLKI